MASIKRRPDGVWRARYRDENGRERARHFGRKVDAQNWLDEVTTSMVTGQYVDPDAGKMTFSQFYGEWSARQVWVKGTERAMALAAGSVEFGNLPLRSLRRSHVETWVKGMLARGLEPGTVHTRFGNVHAVIRAAVRDRRIATDPAEGITLPRLRRAESAMRLPLATEVRALIDNSDDEFKPMLLLAAFAGLRVGEICGVQLGDVEFLGRTLNVRRQVQRERGSAVEIRPPKYNSERAIYLPDQLVTALSEHVATKKITAPDAWLFKGQHGLPAHQNTVTYYWGKARKAAGISDIRMHDMRHFFASGLIAEGCDVITVQRALGHAKATTTLTTYAHLWPTAEDRTRRAAGALFTAVVGAVADSRRTREGS